MHAVINLDLLLWETHLGDRDEFLKDIKLTFTVALSDHEV